MPTVQCAAIFSFTMKPPPAKKGRFVQRKLQFASDASLSPLKPAAEAPTPAACIDSEAATIPSPARANDSCSSNQPTESLSLLEPVAEAPTPAACTVVHRPPLAKPSSASVRQKRYYNAAWEATFPWVMYDSSKDVVFCTYCSRAEEMRAPLPCTSAR